MTTSSRLTCLDLFAGAGGLSSGFARAGFRVAGAIESIETFSATHRLNFPECATLTADVADLRPRDAAAHLTLRRDELDVLIGGPPCQTFSTIGTPKLRSIGAYDVLSDPRNHLFKEYAAYVKYFRPKAFVLENVPQMRTKYGGRLFQRMMNMFADLNYTLHVFILNAVNFGVPQQRKRLFLIGTKQSGSFNAPVETHVWNPAGQAMLDFGREAATTVYDALADLPIVADGSREHLLEYSKHGNLTPYQKRMRRKGRRVGNNICRISNERAKRVFAQMSQGQRYMDLPASVRRILPFREDIFRDRLKRLVLSEPSWTVLAHIGMDGYMYIHPSQHRTLSVREAARIQGFHDSFTFVGNMREQYVQVGNAVPPLLAERVAFSVKASLLGS